MGIRINIMSVFVDDQAKALAFYTERSVFYPRTTYRSVSAAGSRSSVQRTLLVAQSSCSSLISTPSAKPYKSALVADGIPAASFAVDNVRETYAELVDKGVRFTQEPTVMGPEVTAVLDDTCGNLIQLTSPATASPGACGRRV